MQENQPNVDPELQIKELIKDAILDGKIPNDHEAAFQLMLEKAASMGLYPKNKE